MAKEGRRDVAKGLAGVLPCGSQWRRRREPAEGRRLLPEEREDGAVLDPVRAHSRVTSEPPTQPSITAWSSQTCSPGEEVAAPPRAQQRPGSAGRSPAAPWTSSPSSPDGKQRPDRQKLWDVALQQRANPCVRVLSMPVTHALLWKHINGRYKLSQTTPLPPSTWYHSAAGQQGQRWERSVHGARVSPPHCPPSHLPHLDLLGQDTGSPWLSRRVEMCCRPQEKATLNPEFYSVGNTSAQVEEKIAEQLWQRPSSPALLQPSPNNLPVGFWYPTRAGDAPTRVTTGTPSLPPQPRVLG